MEYKTNSCGQRLYNIECHLRITEKCTKRKPQVLERVGSATKASCFPCKAEKAKRYSIKYSKKKKRQSTDRYEKWRRAPTKK